MEIYAIINGNWNNTATWSSGTIPTADDVVYLNGWTINLASTMEAKEIHNDTCPSTGVSGGTFASTYGTYNIIADIIADYKMFTWAGNPGGSLYITGNVTCPTNGIQLHTMSVRSNLFITGNVNVRSGILTYCVGGNWNCSISGNITIDTNGLLFRNATVFNTPTINGSITNAGELYLTPQPIQINGNLSTLSDIVNVTQLNVLGTITITNSATIYCTTLNIAYGITYSGSNANRGVETSQINISDPSLFYWVNTEDTPDYPAESNVKKDIIYDFGRKVGTYEVIPDYPPEGVVMQGYEYADGEMTGTMDVSVQVGCVTKEDVREGVALLGMGESGTLVVPSVDDVREGVVFDNGSVGTLIVQGGGDRLRIADFGYYTNSQSDTYIVDITEADKPKFASAEERILIEMFPELDLANIPEIYFDELFVKFLKYRLIVEYYRTAGVNSTFTPSEPTTEIVNYRNVTCEVWLNSANTYLNAWNKKYGLNKPPKKVRL